MKTLLHRIALLCFTALLGPSFAAAQEEDMPPPSGERLKEIKAQKSAYITTRLNLTPEEAQQFWPIYNKMDEKREALRREMRELRKGGRGEEQQMSEAEATTLIDKSLANRQKELDLEKSYSERFKKSIGAVKTVQLHKAEHDFNREVLRKFRDRMEDRRGGPPRGR
jgi:Spy/CpxP family protein refolding chaperone